MLYAYVAFGYIANDSSFYASLRSEFILQDQKVLQIRSENLLVSDQKKSNDVNEEIDISLFDSFLKEMKADYQNSSLQLYIALNKFAEWYQM
ncbi:5980_t:CDS:2, partial [Funneliformis caledonium]